MNSVTDRRRVTRIAAATLAVLAIAPAAMARPIMDQPTRPIEIDRSVPAPVIVRAVDEGFDWGSAGIGAAATGGLVLVAAGGFVAARHTRVRAAR